MGEVEPRLQSCTSASQALLCSWQVLSNQRAATGLPGARHHFSKRVLFGPGLRRGCGSGADAPVAAVPQLHTASLLAGAGAGEGRQPGDQGRQRARDRTVPLAHPPRLGSRWPEVTRPDPSPDPRRGPVRGKDAFASTQTSFWKGGLAEACSHPTDTSERSLLSWEFRM